MKLYTNKRGDWAGTQATARKLEGSYIGVDVPVSKADLLVFLNDNKVSASTTTDNNPPPSPKDNPELLSHDAASWVSWAYERLRRGKKGDAEAMLLKGLQIQRDLTKDN